MNKNAPLYDVRKIRDLREMFQGSIEEYADKNAFLTKPVIGQPYVPVTYRAFGDDIQAFGTKLHDLGVLHDVRVAILSETRYEWYVSYAAIVCGLGVVVPLDKELPAVEITSMLERAQVSVVIVSPGKLDILREAASGLDFIKAFIVMDYQDKAPYNTEPAAHSAGLPLEYSWTYVRQEGQKLLDQGHRGYLDCEIDPHEMRILLFTSGTTDKSKAVMHSHSTISYNLMAMCSMLYVGNDTVLSLLPLHHTYEATCDFLCQIYRGSTIAQAEGLRYIADNLKESKTTLLLTVPLLTEAFHKRIWKSIDKQGKRKTVETGIKLTRFLRKIGIDVRRKVFKDILNGLGGGYLKTIIAGGAAIDPQVLRDFNDWGITAVQGYGLTECGPILALNRDVYHKDESAGLPLPGVEVKVANPDENGIGEFIAKGGNIMLGYYGDEELTRKSIVNGYYYTGDLGYIDEDGFLIITGRKKNVIVTKNGKNIFPEELEALLQRNAEIKEAIVSGVPDKRGDIDVVVEIFPDLDEVKLTLGKDNPSDAEIQDLIQKRVTAMNHNVPPYKAIKQVTLRSEPFAKNTSSKIKRDYSKSQQA